jgi:hypothetical protein
MVKRRDFMRMLAALPIGGAPEIAPNRPSGAIGGEATMIVAGPEGGRVDRVAVQLAPLLARSLSGCTQIQRKDRGGLDGVTAANQFSARAAPDGETVLLVPGSAALAWLVGDSRAHFDTAAWLPLLAGSSSGLVAARLPAEAVGPGARLRIATDFAAHDLPALLAIELLGATILPVRGLHNDAALRDALVQGEIDLVFLREHALHERVAVMQGAGAQPLFSLGATAETGDVVRDPLLAELPAFPEYFQRVRGVAPDGPLYAAWRAAAAASQLEFALVLPQLTPSAKVAVWRQAAAAAVDTIGWYPSGVVRVQPPAMATVCIAATAADAPTQLELRRWMAVRFDWRPV